MRARAGVLEAMMSPWHFSMVGGWPKRTCQPSGRRRPTTNSSHRTQPTILIPTKPPNGMPVHNSRATSRPQSTTEQARELPSFSDQNSRALPFPSGAALESLTCTCCSEGNIVFVSHRSMGNYLTIMFQESGICCRYTIPPGVYRLVNSITIVNTVNFTLAAAGVELITEQPPIVHINFYGNTNLTFSGPLTLEGDPFGTTQVPIQSQPKCSAPVLHVSIACMACVLWH